LLIEDNPGDARLIREMLAEARGVSFDLEQADRLSAGLERLAEGDFDVVLLDLGLPESQGLDTCARVQAQVSEVPIVVLTGLDDEELAVRAVEAGAQDYLVKGQVDPNPLARALRYAVERKRAEEALREHREHLEELVAERTAQLRESEEKARAQYKGIPVPTYTWQKVGEDLVLVDYNDAAEAITQGKVADFVGIKLGEMYRDRPEIREDICRCFAEKATIKREMPYRFQSTGEDRRLAVKYAFVPPDLVLIHTEDITERVRAEEEARKHAAELRKMVNAMAGREVRMAELKDVIRQLRAQLEEAGLTPVADDPLLAGS
jgi:DNA-binding response OmpR family regulator